MWPARFAEQVYEAGDLRLGQVPQLPPMAFANLVGQLGDQRRAGGRDADVDDAAVIRRALAYDPASQDPLPE